MSDMLAMTCAVNKLVSSCFPNIHIKTFIFNQTFETSRSCYYAQHAVYQH
jgi:hypothetical protein